MGKNLAGRLNRLLSVTAGRFDDAAVAAAEARLAPVYARRLAHFKACIRAKHEGGPEGEYVHAPYDGEEEGRELVSRYRSQFYPPGYDAGAKIMRKLNLIRERQQAAAGLKLPFETMATTQIMIEKDIEKHGQPASARRPHCDG